ncbi:MAG: hypothetical protein ACRCVU_13215, partial [Flavobacterium sp.]
TVNTMPSITTIVGEVKNTLNGTELVTSVNNVASFAIDLQSVINGGQKTSSVGDGVNTTVSTLVSNNHTTYKVNVSKQAIQDAQQKTIVTQGAGTIVTPTVANDTTTYQVAVDPATITLVGDVVGALNNNKVVAIQNVNVSSTSPIDKQVLTYNQSEQVWKATTPQVEVENVLSAKALTSTDLDLSTGASTALLKDVVANIKTGAVTSAKILDGTILPEDIANAGNSQVLVTSTTGQPLWTNQTTLVQNNQKVTQVTGSGGVIVVPTINQNTTTYDVSVKSAMPKFFYMPSVLLPTAEGQTTQSGVTFSNATRKGTVDLYTIYQAQFGSPVIANRAGAILPVINVTDLDFFITYVDSSVFINLQLTEQGLLT